MQHEQLLGKAVVALEKRLRDSTALVSELEADLAEARHQSAELPAVRQSLADSQAARDTLEQELQRRQHALKQAVCEAEEACDQGRKAQAAVQAADSLLQQARADAEALRIEGSRARGEADVLSEQVQQLEAANGSLRQDSKVQAAQLRAAYER